MQQLPLGVRLQDRAVFASFLAGGNGEPLAALRATAAGTGERTLYLHGATGSGKSHLLQAFCATLPGSGYFPLAQLRDAGPGILEGADLLTAVAVDDLEQVTGETAWEQGLFKLYNECEQRGVRMVMSASTPASALGMRLNDLKSRLASAPHYGLILLDDRQQRSALQLRAAMRGLELPEETAQWLQRRYPRDMASLHGLLDRLDTASLAEQRRLTVPFIRQVIGDQP